MSEQELEEMTLQFLREHDDKFLCKRKNKTMQYPYLSERQLRSRHSREIPLSNLSNKQKLKVPKLGDSIDWGSV